MSADPNDTLSGDPSLALPEFDVPPANPLALLADWMTEAERAGVSEPRAVSLATADRSGEVTSRVVLLKDVDACGELVFTSHTGSRKGRDLAENPSAAITFYWRERLQQVNVRGRVALLAAARSDALFEQRPRAAQATTAASQQSHPLVDAAALVAEAGRLTVGDDPLVRPEGWSGYALTADAVEFWHGSPDRLHRRLLYTRQGSAWTSLRLQP